MEISEMNAVPTNILTKYQTKIIHSHSLLSFADVKNRIEMMSSSKNPKQVNALLLTQNDHLRSSQSNSIYFHRKSLITFQIFH